MLLGGFQKMTLIDFPGKIATTVFTVGCNFRCPFCHNPELVLTSSPLFVKKEEAKKIETDFFQHLKKRKGQLEGVCITGGEPTVQPDIVEFIKKIKKMGYAVKLDTNGTHPKIIERLINEKLVDYIAMDIKNQIDKYNLATGVDLYQKQIKESVKLIMQGGIPYEFRTTVVPGIHTLEDFLVIAKWLKGADKYWLQKYTDGKILDPALKEKIKNKKLDLEQIKKSIEKNFGQMNIR
jgi:pyruvate formate lyase activating enzyme